MPSRFGCGKRLPVSPLLAIFHVRVDAAPAIDPFRDTFEGHIEHRNDEEADETRREHAGEDRRAHVAPADLGGAMPG
jgi:hypothetical protein